MSLIVTPYIFQPGTTIASAQVNANFAAINAVVNGNLDGTNFATVFSSLNLATKGHATFPGGLILQWGKASSVAFDNSAVSTPAFDIAFTTAVYGIFLQVQENTQTTPAMVNAYWNDSGVGAPLTTFNLTAMGGQAGTTGTVYWFAFGQ